jgi:hypothetical protein
MISAYPPLTAGQWDALAPLRPVLARYSDAAPESRRA